MDVQIEEAIGVAECILVWRARGKKYSDQFIQNWAAPQWQSAPYKNFKVLVLAKGWFMVKFENKEVVDWVMGKIWAFGNHPVLFR